jgi:nitrogen fixation/metabolism regulation signal transduction histidine kinase
MKVRFTLMAALAPSACMLLAAPALAGDNGEGLVGETNDKIITYFSLGLVVFFVVVALLGSWLQSLLERRKEERKASELRQRIGW